MNSQLALTPPEAPLAMPTQVLSRHPGVRTAQQSGVPWPARLLTFGGALLLTLLCAQDDDRTCERRPGCGAEVVQGSDDCVA